MSAKKKIKNTPLLNLGEKLTFWEYLGFVSIFLFVIQSYLPESRTPSLIYLFLILILGYCVLIRWLEFNRLVQQGNKKELLILNLIIELIHLAIFAYIFQFFALMILLPDTITSSVITVAIITMIVAYNSINNPFSISLNQKNYNFEGVLAFLISGMIAYFCSKLYFLSNYNVIKAFSILSLTDKLLFTITGLLVLQQLLVYLFNKTLDDNDSFCQYFQEIKVKKIITLIIYVLCISYILILPIILPLIETKQPYKEERIDNCTSTKIYSSNNNNKLLNLYIFTIPQKNYSDVQLILSGILKKDGEYQTIDLMKDEDKSNIQYYQTMRIDDLGVSMFRFLNKNIYLVDKLELKVTINNC